MELLSEIFRKARKDHVCTGCLEKIRVGETYHLQSWKDCGDLYSVKLCAKCYFVFVHFLDDEYSEGQLVELHEFISTDVDVCAHIEKDRENPPPNARKP